MSKKFLNIRPDASNDGLVEKLEFLAKKDERSLNRYVVRVLAAHVKNRLKLKKTV